MSDDLKSALSAKEWATLGPNGVGHPIMPSCVADIEYLDPHDVMKAMAVANWCAPDAYKITRADVALLAEAIAKSDEHYDELSTIIAKLAALLPPETP